LHQHETEPPEARCSSLILTATSLLSLPEFPVRPPHRSPQPANFNRLDINPGIAVAIFPASRELAASLALATALRQ
jgi:hypothetical protein